MKINYRVKHYMTRLALASAIYFSTAGNAIAELRDIIETSDNKHYRVSCVSKVTPLPLNSIHSWVIHVDTINGNPVENASISVHGGMPAHKHGLPTQPEVTEIGGGDYLLEGLKFSMSGIWHVWFDIREKEITDKVKFTVEF
jgi:hypothetical protein